MSISTRLIHVLEEIAQDLAGEAVSIHLEHPEDPTHGDYATNVAFMLTKKLKASPVAIAEQIREKLLEKKLEEVKDVSVAAPGFVNITLTQEFFITRLSQVLSTDELEKSSQLSGKKILVEYAHPNTHKEMHIGHMRTLITGEAVARLLEAAGGEVFRANYQGDIGPHVAKALWGIQQLMQEEGLDLERVMSWSNKDKAHFLGRGYVVGSQKYEENKDAIDNINMQLYLSKQTTNNKQPTTSEDLMDKENSPEVSVENLYQITRQWSLDYYDEFYHRFGTTFDRLFFESEMVETGKKIVEENIGKVFVRDNGAVVFPGEKYAVPAGRQGLHTRVFITQAGNPTYEGKEMGNAFAEQSAFPFDLKMHVVANEQAGYFQVVFKALELIDPEKFEDKQFHLSMGMFQLIGRKISSRTGDILTVDWLLDQVQEKVEELVTDGRIGSDKKAMPAGMQVELTDQIVTGAVKYSVLKVGATQDVAFDINKSVSLEGDSGPYLQYSYARTQSVLRKAGMSNVKYQMSNIKLEEEEMKLLRLLAKFDETVIEAAEKYAPNIVATYLYDLASTFNLFYQKHSILNPSSVISTTLIKSGEERSSDGSQQISLRQPRRISLRGQLADRNDNEEETRDFRLALTAGVGKTIKRGLNLLGIEAPEKM